ncbi:MAG TPA: cobalamin-binding protein [Candidatus Acidoferrales bacterium]|jgi:iron complex transport system substrate-binding protein|nr:cobalamin-binding protein [Candidatus Acidoferrales bacterium]
MKICSLLPSATEILFALGLGDHVAGVSHECDFPWEAQSRPVLIKSRISHTESAAAIDRQVREFLERGESLYSVEMELLREIEPDIIVTQDLCHVCAATPDDLGAALSYLPNKPKIVTLNPHSLADVCADIRAIGEATASIEQADELIAEFQKSIADVEQSVAGLDRPRVLCLEWLDPPYVAGHWVPEMVERAGGIDVLGQRSKPSFRVDWEKVMESQPEVIVIMPCGYNLAAADAEFRSFPLPTWWGEVPAVKEGRVFIVDASGYFSRPGPRLAVGLRTLASAIHAEKRDSGAECTAEGPLVRVASVR